MSTSPMQTDPSRDPSRDLDRDHTGDLDSNATSTSRRGTVPDASIGRAGARHGREVGWRSRDVVRAATLVLGLYLLTKLFWTAYPLFLTLFLGILFGIAVSAGVDRLQRLRVPRALGAVLIVLSFLGLLFGFAAWMAPTLRDQGKELRQKLPLAVDRVQEWMGRRQNGIFGVLLGGGDGGDTRPAKPQGATDTVTTPSTAKQPGDSARSDGVNLKRRLAGHMPRISKYLFPFLTTTAEAVGGTLLIIFLSIYFAADPDLYRRGALALLPGRRRELGAQVLDRVAIVLRKWLVTQLIAMLVMGAVSTVALLVLHVKAPFALGIISGLFQFIPTLGPLLSSVPAIAMAFLDSPEKALVVILVYFALHFLESHIMIPLLMKGGLNLPPALTVVSQALMALVFGFMGLMVAVPMLATVVVLIQMLYVQRPSESDGLVTAHDPDLDEALSDGAAAAR